MQNPVIELVNFQLVANTDEASFLKASAAVDAFCHSQPGFVWRRLAKGDDGAWIDCIEWTDMGSAQLAAKAMPAANGVGPFLSAIDMESVSMRHLHVMASN